MKLERMPIESEGKWTCLAERTRKVEICRAGGEKMEYTLFYLK